MHFKGIKIGKSKDKAEKDKIKEEEQTGRDENPGATAGQSPGLPDLSADEETPPKPHGPLQELTVEPAGDMEDMEFNGDIDDSIPSEEAEEAVKLVELKAETGAPAEEESAGLETDTVAPAEEKKEAKPEPADDSFNSLFADDEEEENPLANLINSLPDVTASEILSDISEIKEIMREGH